MTSVLASAFAQGFTADQVIQYLVRHSPQYARQIASATGVGYTPKQILRYLTKDNAKERAAATEYEETRTRDNTNRTNANKAVIGGAVAATGLPIAASAGSAALSRALPQTLRNQAPQIANAMGNGGSNQGMTPPQPTTGTPQQPSNQIPSQQPPNPISPNVPNTQQGSQQPPLSNANAASIPQPPDIKQPEINNDKLNKLYSGFEKGRDKGFDFESDAFLKVAKRMKSTGEIRSKEDFEKFFNLFDAKKNEGKDLPTALKEASIEYDNQKLSSDPTNPYNELHANSEELKEIQNKASETYLKPSSEEKVALPGETNHQIAKRLGIGYAEASELAEKRDSQDQEKPKIEKNSVVSSPNGVGEVKSIKEKTALVDIDGKLTKVNVEDLESEPPDIADLYDNLFNAIPKEYQSRMMNYAGYDEDANELIFRPHGGAAYVYKDIPPQFAEDLKNRLHNAKTTGKNMYGMWNEGDPSYGAGMSALIKELQKTYGGKGKEYVRKYNTLFDILGIPHEEKKRKEQEERRKRKANG